MSRYGEDGSTGYAKEDLLYAIEEFLETHPVSEMLRIVADAVMEKED